MEKALVKKLDEYNLKYVPLDKDSLRTVKSLWIDNKKERDEILNGLENFYYGLYYQYVKNDIIKAEEYFKKAALQNEANAMNSLALIYQLSADKEKFVEKFFKNAIELGNVDAMVNYGFFLEDVYGDLENAIKYYTAAYDAGNSLAAYYLGRLYEKNKNALENNNVDYAQYYKIAADNGIVEAQTAYGLYLEYIKGDAREAAKYYRMAIRNKDPKAMYLYGKHLYENRNKAEGEKLLNQAAKMNYGDAYAALAYYYKKEGKTQRQILSLLKKGVELRSDKANLAMGNYFYEKKDYEKAKIHFERAISLGNISALNNLGQLYIMVENDDARGLKYIREAANAGDRQALKTLARIDRDQGNTSKADQEERAAELLDTKAFKRELEYESLANNDYIKGGDTKARKNSWYKKAILTGLAIAAVAAVGVGGAAYAGYIDIPYLNNANPEQNPVKPGSEGFENFNEILSGKDSKNGEFKVFNDILNKAANNTANVEAETSSWYNLSGVGDYLKSWVPDFSGWAFWRSAEPEVDSGVTQFNNLQELKNYYLDVFRADPNNANVTMDEFVNANSNLITVPPEVAYQALYPTSKNLQIAPNNNPEFKFNPNVNVGNLDFFYK